jgi:hypothetical protein
MLILLDNKEENCGYRLFIKPFSPYTSNMKIKILNDSR